MLLVYAESRHSPLRRLYNPPELPPSCVQGSRSYGIEFKAMIRTASARTLIGLIVLVIASPTPCLGMRFTQIIDPPVRVGAHEFPEHTSVVADGPIIEGDAIRFARSVQDAGRDQWGNVTVYFNSPGGSVAEALRFVPIMDKFEITAVVRDGEKCASACASILYLSARIHFVEDGGLIGFHSCETNNHLPLDLCNEHISDNALYHGTAVGNVLSLMNRHIPEDLNTLFDNEIIWFSKTSAITFGLYGPPNYDASLALPSFDCTSARSETYKLICRSPQLARYDSSLARIYELISDLPPHVRHSRQDLAVRQARWIAERDACNAKYDCVYMAYSQWRNSLRKEYTLGKILQLITSIDPNKRSKKLDYADRLLRRCRGSDYCESLGIPEHAYDFFTDNNAMHFVRAVTDGKFDGSSDCFFYDLCDESIKTFDPIKLGVENGVVESADD